MLKMKIILNHFNVTISSQSIVISLIYQTMKQWKFYTKEAVNAVAKVKCKSLTDFPSRPETFIQ